MADSEADLQEQLVDWKEIFRKDGLTGSLEKTEVLWVGQQKQFSRQTEWEETEPRDCFVHLGGTVCGDCSTETDICRRI